MWPLALDYSVSIGSEVFEFLELDCKGGCTLVTLLRNVTPYHDSVEGTLDHVMYQKLVMR
jgi:hypothetical protein